MHGSRRISIFGMILVRWIGLFFENKNKNDEINCQELVISILLHEEK